MKSIYLVVCFLFTAHFFNAQDTLRMQYTHGYSQYFVLKENNGFELFFHHCTGTTYGKGNVKKGLFKWVFIFDEHPSQESDVVIDSSFSSNSIEITGWITYFDCKKMVLQKRKNAFFERDVRFEENEEKPWKKTKVRFRNWYKFG